MSGLLSYLKKSELQLPVSLGRMLAKIPFGYRPGLGSVYRQQRSRIDAWPAWAEETQKAFIYASFMPVFRHAYEHIPFYRNLYREQGIEWQDIRSFEDIGALPVINKKMLLEIPLEERSYPVKNRILVNTGGSSGATLSFYMDPLRFGNEWAHLHHIWGKLGYCPHDLKLTFDGRSSMRKHIQYDFVRHSLRYNIYESPEKNAVELSRISGKYPIKYLHGYPSAIADFAQFCQDQQPQLTAILKNSLKGAFLSSEFPLAPYRKAIESTFDIPTQSFYGHTETCVMAFENAGQYRFEALQTYGYTEVLPNADNTWDLAGTSYFNFASPFIRYNTEDEIQDLDYKNGLLHSFAISSGRKGSFLIDRDGRKISVTGLIFGRHHRLFDICRHLQVKQPRPGLAQIMYVLNTAQLVPEHAENLFDNSKINMEFEFVRLEKPVLTKSGKVKLMIS